jgi:hypothetical protein
MAGPGGMQATTSAKRKLLKKLELPLLLKKLFQMIVICCDLQFKPINPVSNPESTFYKMRYHSVRNNKFDQ